MNPIINAIEKSLHNLLNRHILTVYLFTHKIEYSKSAKDIYIKTNSVNCYSDNEFH